MHNGKCIALKRHANRFKIANPMFLARADIAHDLHIFRCTRLGPKTSGNLHLHLAESDAPFRLVIAKRYIPISGKTKNIRFVISESLQQTQNFPFPGSASLALLLFGRRIIRNSLGNQGILFCIEGSQLLRCEAGCAIHMQYVSTMQDAT